MSEKKELDKEQLDKVNGGGTGRDGRDGAVVKDTQATDFNAIYGVENQDQGVSK